MGDARAKRGFSKGPALLATSPDRKTMQTKEQLPDLAIREGD